MSVDEAAGPVLAGLDDARVMPGGFADLAGFAQDDLAAAFACFARSANVILAGAAELRPALPRNGALLTVCTAAERAGPWLSPADARAFFEAHFDPVAIAGAGREGAFFTGYYEPEVEGSLERAPGFAGPILARPADLRTFAAGDARPDWADGFSAARVEADGSLSPYPDRADIEMAAPDERFRPVVWLRDVVEVFLVQVQGSARVRLQDGTLLRLTYAGRNGHPYTSIGRLLVEAGHIPADAMSLDRLKAWLRQNGQELGEPGRAVMQRNASYIFFDAAPGSGEAGPTGGQGLPLTPLRSIAIDRALWCYGLPFWVAATLPWTGVAPTPFARLMIAQDTGSAIVGPARADLFFGSGAEAGRRAGDIHHHGSMIVLRPRAAA